jgi:hypothetical protein
MPPWEDHGHATLESDRVLDDFVRLAAEVCAAPSAVLSIGTTDRVRNVSRAGPAPSDAENKTSL